MKIKDKIALLLLLLATLTGCDMKDHFVDTCYRPYLLKVLVDPNADDYFDLSFFDPDDVSQMIEAHEVLVYVFSNQGVLLGTHRAVIGEVIELPYDTYDQLDVKAVATAAGEPIETMFAQLKVGQTYTDADQLFALTPITKAAAVAESPIDFMYASSKFAINPYNDQNILNVMYVKPRIGAIKIITHGIRDWADRNFGASGVPNDAFTFEIGTTLDKYNLAGELYGEQKSYIPNTLYDDENSQIKTPMFNMMPTTETKPVVIIIYRNGTNIYPYTPIEKKRAYKVPPRSPYIIDLFFGDSGGDDGGFTVTPAKFQDIYATINF